MPMRDGAQVCPHLTLLPGRFDAPTKPQIISAKSSRATPPRIEPLSLDEGLSRRVTDSVHCATVLRPSSPEIRQTIFNELQLTASAGVAPVKFLAKIASDMNKPSSQFVITPAEFRHFTKPYHCKNPRRRQSLGSKTGSDGAEPAVMYKSVIWVMLLKRFGKFGRILWSVVRGID